MPRKKAEPAEAVKKAEPVGTGKKNKFKAKYLPSDTSLAHKLKTLGIGETATSYEMQQRWQLPETMGSPPESVKVANDSAWAPAQTLLEHSLGGIYSMGYPCFVGFPTLASLSQIGIIRSAVEARSNSLTAEWGDVVYQDSLADDVKKTPEQEAEDAKKTEEEEGEEKVEKDKSKADLQSKVVKVKIKAIERSLEKHKIRQLFNTAADNCGYFGGCYLFIDNGETTANLVNPLVLTKQTFKSGSLKGFRMIEPYLVTPTGYNSWNPMASDYFVPQTYYIQGIPVHKSRLIIFKENQLPTLLLPAYNFVGLSMSQRMLDAVSHYTESREAMVRMLLKCSTMVFATDMSEIFNGGVEDTLATRIKYFAENRDLDGVAVLDKEREALESVQTSLAGMADIVTKTQEQVCASAMEPVVKLFGISPSGFNTGEADLQNYLENMVIFQEKLFHEPIRKVLKVIQMNLFGEVDEDIKFTFAPLNETDEGAKLNNELLKAQIDAQLIQMGVISPEDVRSRILNDEDSGYSALGEMPQPLDGPGSGNEQMDPKKMQEMMGGGEQPNGPTLPPNAQLEPDEQEEEVEQENTDLSPEEEQELIQLIEQELKKD